MGRRGEKRVGERKLPADVKTTDVIVGDKVFITNMAMGAQAQEFQEIYRVMPDIHMRSFGDGLITAILKEREKLGYKT